MLPIWDWEVFRIGFTFAAQKSLSLLMQANIPFENFLYIKTFYFNKWTEFLADIFRMFVGQNISYLWTIHGEIDMLEYCQFYVHILFHIHVIYWTNSEKLFGNWSELMLYVCTILSLHSTSTYHIHAKYAQSAKHAHIYYKNGACTKRTRGGSNVWCNNKQRTQCNGWIISKMWECLVLWSVQI